MFKLKRSQRGFAAIETGLIIVIVALIAFVAWYAFHTKGNTEATLGNAANIQTEPSKNQESKAISKKTVAAQVVTTKTNSTSGQYLADIKGRTLYTYGADTSGVSNCTGTCLATWPIYQAATASDLPANVTVITRSDGTKQYAYKGMPLYYYTGDNSTGQVTGDGVNNFHVAKP